MDQHHDDQYYGETDALPAIESKHPSSVHRTDSQHNVIRFNTNMIKDFIRDSLAF